MKRVLIANRGEIAVRIARACQAEGLVAIAIYSETETRSLHVAAADEAVAIGVSANYLNGTKIIDLALEAEADALHPGYGFLSENAKFSEIVNKHGIKFIGPSAEIISKMGDKIEAKRIAKKFGLPVIEGSEGGVKSFEEAKSIVNLIGD